MLSKINTCAVNGLETRLVTIEVHTYVSSMSSEGQGLARIQLVGLPDNAVKESKTRVRAALANSGYHLPEGMCFDINFAPADMRKEGASYDLPLAVAMLQASALAHISQDLLEGVMLVGELGLAGEIRPVRGVLPVAILARRLKMRALIVPSDNAREAAVVNDLTVYGADNLRDVVDLLEGHRNIAPTNYDTRAEFARAMANATFDDFADVKGQDSVKRAFEVAAAGGHNIIVIGSPGCGKSMMAKRLPSILPPLSLAESLETTQLHSIAGKLGADSSLITQRPFRAPHHKVSDVALIGGGANFQPGEISLAHNGVLFLDEFPEFSKNVLETLRQPLEDRHISISRAKYSVDVPCSIMLVAAMNPCPCGYYNDPTHHCHCSPGQIQRYMSKISGPLLDRIDLQVEVAPVPLDKLQELPSGETSADIRQRVIAARQIQQQRFADTPRVHCNAQMTAAQIREYAQPDAEGATYLQQAMRKLDLSARSYERILKVARTIADLAGSAQVTREHLSEAISYRNLDRSSWGE